VGSFALGFLAEEGASVVVSDSTTRTRFLEAEEGAEESFEGVALAGVATLELFGVDLAIFELIEVVRVEIVENKFSSSLIEKHSILWQPYSGARQFILCY